MMNARLYGRLGSLVLTAALASAARGQALDQIVPWRGTSASGSVVEMSTTEVKLDARGKTSTFAVNEIRRIQFAEDAPELRRAREDVTSGQYEQALDALKRVDGARIERDLVLADLQYYLAFCQGRIALTGGGDKASAASAMLEFVRKNPNNYHFFDAAQLLGDLAMALGNHENALKYYGAISRAPWPDYAMRGSLLEGAALTALGKFSEAQAKYEQVAASALDTSEATRNKTLALIGNANCLAEGGKPDQGVDLVNDVIAKNDPQDLELFGRAYNALGKCHLKANRQKEALLAYLHTDILFHSQPDVHAEALYHLAALWTAVNKADRALAARNLLVERYAGSVWAKRN